MDQQLKQRIVGAAVLVALAVIFIPVFLDDGMVDEYPVESHEFATQPGADFNSRVVPLDEDDIAQVEQASAASAVALAPPASGAGSEPGDGIVADDAVPELDTTESAPRTGVTAWVVQLGSFTSESNARALEARLRASGYQAFVDKLRENAQTSYRVRVGPELSRPQADELLRKLAKEVEIRGMVLRYP